MKAALLATGAALAVLTLAPYAHADAVVTTPVGFTFSGPSAGGGTISGSGTFAIATTPTEVGVPSGAGYAITGVTGTFSDSNSSVALKNESINGLVPIDPVDPTPSSVANDPSFSRYTAGTAAGFVSYDNLFFWGNASLVCNGYPFSGGIVDTYGALLKLANGDTLDFWSNGILPHGSAPSYGIYLLSSTGSVLDNSPIPPNGQDPSGITASVPEPSSLALLATAVLIGSLAWRRRPADEPAS